MGKKLHTSARLIVKIGLLALLVIMVYSCAEMQQLVKAVDIKKPTAKVDDVKITGLSLEEADLEFDIAVSNPNAVSITLAGFDYDLLLNNQSFIKGKQDKTVKVAANGTSAVKLPLSLHYMDIYKTYQALAREDHINYALKTGLIFDVPVLGRVRIPVETKGSFPTIKIPLVKLQALKLNNLGLSGADLQLDLQIDNPNAFAVNLNRFHYNFKVAGQNWIQGQNNKPYSVAKKGHKTLSIPIKLNFLEIGRSVFNLLNGSSKLDYRLSGSADVGSSLPMLKNFPMNYDYTGKVEITR